MFVNIGRVFGGRLRGNAGDEENTKKAKCGKAGCWQWGLSGGWISEKAVIWPFFNEAFVQCARVNLVASETDICFWNAYSGGSDGRVGDLPLRGWG